MVAVTRLVTPAILCDANISGIVSNKGMADVHQGGSFPDPE